MTKRHAVKVGHGILLLQVVVNTPFGQHGQPIWLTAKNPPGTRTKVCGLAVESCDTAAYLVRIGEKHMKYLALR